MDERKIAFISCVNKEEEFAEALYYINRLRVPSGYTIDVIAVREASSMTEGYQAAMESSDAKYKVYLHQDVFIIHQGFIEDMLGVFAEDEAIGMIGCVGCDELPLDAQAVAAWNVGMVYHNCMPSRMERRQNEDGTPHLAEAVDGLLMATQYDVSWRTDLFDGWDFYDISQCMEMRRAGYKVMVPYQQQPWCYHDNTYSKMVKYPKYCARFIKEYQDIKPFSYCEQSREKTEFEVLREQSRAELIQLVGAGKKQELVNIFLNPENCGYLHLREFETLANIERLENADGTARFWQMGDTYDELMHRMSDLKFALKRLEFDSDEEAEAITSIRNCYSIQAVKAVCIAYVADAQCVWHRLFGEND